MTSVNLMFITLLTVLIAALCEASELKRHAFKPLVAFQCGYRNMYESESGIWVHDEDRYATCLAGKLDILKYCKKVYPRMNITNIVEFSHSFDISNWCREEGNQCKYRHIVRPYMCIEDEFHSEALQVPKDCIFSHFSSRKLCNDKQFWEKKAQNSCTEKEHKNKRMELNSFALLEPCGLDIFGGVEFVCCPPGVPKPVEVEIAETETVKEKADITDEDDEDSEEDDDDEESYTENDEDAEKTLEQDEYFKKVDLSNEHELFLDAMDRLEKKHREKIEKVMKEWSELNERYHNIKKADPKEADKMKTDMTARFQATVASLEEENKKERQDLRTVHDERVTVALNEKIRQATHQFRTTLANQVTSPNKSEVLRTLKKYIRAEEKDRLHQLNKYRHMLRTSTTEAKDFKPLLLHKLRYIDLRINATLAMLRDFPEIENQIRDVILSYWTEFRHDNTPDINDKDISKMNSLDAEAINKKLVDLYTESYKKLHPAKLNVRGPSSTVATPVKVAEKDNDDQNTAVDLDKDAEEDNDEFYEDEQDEEVEKKTVEHIHSKEAIKQEDKKLNVLKPVDTFDDSDSDSESDEDDDSSESINREIRVDIEPIITEKEYSATIRESFVDRSRPTARAAFSQVAFSQILFLFGSALCLLLIGLTFLRRRRAHHGFVEVDVYTSEERHLAGMQVNGYENPTYSFFDSKN